MSCQILAYLQKLFFAKVAFSRFLLGNRQKIAVVANANNLSFPAKMPGCLAHKLVWVGTLCCGVWSAQRAGPASLLHSVILSKNLRSSAVSADKLRYLKLKNHPQTPKNYLRSIKVN